MKKPIETIERFYAHAIALEREAAERYAEFAAYFRGRGDEVLAGLCENLARLEGEHLEGLLQASTQLQLPVIAAHEFEWLDDGAPESPAREFFYKVACPWQLLEVALHAEKCAFDFFTWAARTTTDAQVRVLAQEMADEEQQHIGWVRQALEYNGPAGAPGLDAHQRAPRSAP
jgi:rubrerythrin